jgi:hypothetical protein
MKRSGTLAADERAVTSAAKKSRLDELLNHQARLVGIEIPEALKLPVVEAKSRALVKLTTDSLKHAFESGVVGHNWCGEQNARACAPSSMTEALSGTQPDVSVRRAAPRPRLAHHMCKQYAWSRIV